jgi:hypothetical protein
MKITPEEYFFYEWLIINKNMTDEQFKQLIPKELISLQEEYNVFKNKMK